MTGCVPVLGRLGTVGLFALDECMAPIYAEAAGYFDDCFAAFSSSDNVDEGETFTRKCANGKILYHEDGKPSLQSVQVELDLNAEPSTDFMSFVGLTEPVKEGAKTVGFSRGKQAIANILVAIWQEVIDVGSCGDAEGGGHRLHLYPLKNARLTTEGTLGAEDGYMRIAGSTVAEALIGGGPWPFFTDAGGSTPRFFTGSLLVQHHTVLTGGIAAPPEQCGAVTLVGPAA